MKKLTVLFIIALTIITCICCSSFRPYEGTPTATETPTMAETTGSLTEIPVKAAEHSTSYIVLTVNSIEESNKKTLCDKAYIYVDSILAIESFAECSVWYPGSMVILNNGGINVKESAEEILKMLEGLR